MSLRVKIDNAVNKLSDAIGFLQPMYEAIANSLEAGANEIKIDILPEPALLDEKKSKVASFSIYDNGEGFTKDNLESFGELWTEHKLELGCKGVGRLTWLKVFNEIKIKSTSKDQKIEITFNRAFDPQSQESVKKQTIISPTSWTEITFSNVTKKFLNDTDKNPEKRYDNRIEADVVLIKEKVLQHLRVKLFLLKSEKKRDFLITFKSGSDIEKIDSKNIEKLNKQDFSIKSEIDNKEYDFSLYYNFVSEEKVNHQQFYCANGRTVREFVKDVKIQNLPEKISYISLLTSQYFDNRVDDVRGKFTFDLHDTKATIVDPLIFSNINSVLKTKLDKLLSERFPEILKDNLDILERCSKENPHLKDYFYEDSSIIKTEASLISYAEKRFNEDKKTTKYEFQKLLRTKEASDEEYQQILAKVSDVSAKELAEYIAYRQQIIIALEKLSDNQEKQEKLLHNLFMKMKTDDQSGHIRESNIWLLDDKFMSYFYVASDKQINSIYKKWNGGSIKTNDGGGYRPDMLAIYLSADKERALQDIVVIEFKSPGALHDEKRKSITEIWDNAGVVREEFKNIGTIWAFIITHIDEKFEGTLKRNDYNPLFCNGGLKSYRSYNKNSDVHAYALSIESIVYDADKRNSVFLDIITGDKKKPNISGSV